MDEANFIDLFLARCWHWDRQLKSYTPTPESAALALSEAILIAESRNTKPTKGNTMNKIESIVLDHIGEGEAEILSQILNGQDSMLININELLDIKSKILIFVTENQQRLKKFRDELIQFERLDASIDAILFTRQSLRAAGVEKVAA